MIWYQLGRKKFITPETMKNMSIPNNSHVLITHSFMINFVLIIS